MIYFSDFLVFTILFRNTKIYAKLRFDKTYDTLQDVEELTIIKSY